MVGEIPHASEREKNHAIAVMNKWVSEYSIDLRVELTKSICNAFNKHEIKTHDSHEQLFKEVAEWCAKDLVKLSLYQKKENKVDPLKVFGYLAFWVRKIKPVSNATNSKGSVPDINEKLSLWLLGAMTTRYYVDKAKKEPRNKDINRHSRIVSERFEQLFNSTKRMEYLVHCLRVRTFGPHHYVILLHQIVDDQQLVEVVADHGR